MPSRKPGGRLTGIIGGSGLYQMDGLTGGQWTRVESAFGEPSDELLFGDIDGRGVVFLPRHGRGHRIPPGQINYRANLDALKRAGVTDILSFSAVGSLRERLEPGAFVIVDQFVDRTFAREKSFFGTGLVAHVSMARPVCHRLGDALEEAGTALGLPVSRGGTYITMEGPQFSTLAESELYRSWGCEVIGMTNMPEAKLAREAEICYATVAMVTDYDCWRPGHDAVSVDMVVRVLADNAAKAAALARGALPAVQAGDTPCPSGCDRALDAAVITAPGHQDPQMKARLAAIAARVLADVQN